MVLIAAICLLTLSSPRLIWNISLTDVGMVSAIVNARGEILVGGFTLTTNGKNDDGTPNTPNENNLYDLWPSGRIRWKYRTKTGVSSQKPAVGSDGTVYIAEAPYHTDNGTIADDYPGSFDAIRPNGKALWSRGGEGLGDLPSGPNGTVYADDGDNLLAYGPKGKLLWKKRLPHPQEASFELYGSWSQGLCGYCNEAIYSISFSGSIRKTGSLDGLLPGSRVPTSIVLTDEYVFALVNDDSEAAMNGIDRSNLYRFDRDGNRKLVRSTTDEVEGAFADGANLLLKRGNDTLICVNSDGKVRWSVKPGGQISPPSVRRDGTIFVGLSNGHVVALGSNGKVKWRFKTAGPVEAAPTVSEKGRIYVVCSNGRLEAIRG